MNCVGYNKLLFRKRYASFFKPPLIINVYTILYEQENTPIFRMQNSYYFCPLT